MKINNNEFISIINLNRTHITTNEAAFYLNRSPQTLRVWAIYQKGPIKPIKINGRLAWSVLEICNLLKLGEKNG